MARVGAAVSGDSATQGAVVDTMLFAYALLGVTDRRELASQVLSRAEPIWVPDSLRAELGNVAWQWVLRGGIARDHAHAALRALENVVGEFVCARELLPAALDLACDGKHPLYDTLFVALAVQRGVPLVTDDQRLLAVFPHVAVSPEAFLAGA